MNAPIKTSLERRVFRCASIVIALASLALLPKAHAVVPPPDGGYPNFTTAEETNALLPSNQSVSEQKTIWVRLT